MKTIIYFTILSIFFTCNNSSPKQKVILKDSLNSSKDSTINIKNIFGYRFSIVGDFDGDGKQETLSEHFYSGIDNKETNKFYQGISYEQLVDTTVAKKPFSFAISENKKIDTLQISKAKQLLGLSFLKNEGDLNGDGNDEVSYVVNWADWSACNKCHVVSYKNGKWNEIFSFDIRDWQLPGIPGINYNYGLMGVEKINYSDNDLANNVQEKEFKTFSGFINKKKSGKIEIKTISQEIEDTIIVLREKDLKVKN